MPDKPQISNFGSCPHLHSVPIHASTLAVDLKEIGDKLGWRSQTSHQDLFLVMRASTVFWFKGPALTENLQRGGWLVWGKGEGFTCLSVLWNLEWSKVMEDFVIIGWEWIIHKASLTLCSYPQTIWDSAAFPSHPEFWASHQASAADCLVWLICCWVGKFIFVDFLCLCVLWI